MQTKLVKVELTKAPDPSAPALDPDVAIFGIDQRLEELKSDADALDYLVAACSGVLCAAVDVLWVGEFDLVRGRKISSDEIGKLTVQVAKLAGFDGDDLSAAVRFLEKLAPIPSDANTPDFGGGLQHHLRDFAHHPTVAGLAFSLLTQFTGKAYGTDTTGAFLIVDVPERALGLIGATVPEKILFGTVRWFLHLASDMAGSSSSAARSGGTGIPGPILSLAKELSATPLLRNIRVGDASLSEFLSKLFNGTLLTRRDQNGNMMKGGELRFDLRGELGAAVELGRQALPVVANECLVRGFYLIRHLASEIARVRPSTIEDMKRVSWESVRPFGNPTVDRMLTVATSVFTGIDVASAAAGETLLLSINYPGVCRFAVALGKDVGRCLKARDLKRIRGAYETIRLNTYTLEDRAVHDRIGAGLDISMFGLTTGQTEILYNIDRLKVLHDIGRPAGGTVAALRANKEKWLEQWSKSMEDGFPKFIGDPSAKLHWMEANEVRTAIDAEGAGGVWLRLVILEAMAFEPYYPLDPKEGAEGALQRLGASATKGAPLVGYSESGGDSFLELFFEGTGDGRGFVEKGRIRRLRKRYSKVSRGLNEVLKKTLITIGTTAVVTLAAVMTSGIGAGPIATALVGSNFSGLSGAALTSACLAYLGGGAVAAGGLGMAGGTAAIVGGGALLGLGVGGAAGTVAGNLATLGKRSAIAQSAKLLTAVEEIYLNDERDLKLSESVLERYEELVVKATSDIKRLRIAADKANGPERKELKRSCRESERTVRALERAMKDLRKFSSSFSEGLEVGKHGERG